jgi:hypothetical protein
MGLYAETAIVDDRLSLAEQGKQTPVFVSVCSKQTEACRFRFLFAGNKRKLPFPLVLLSICEIPETCSRGDVQTWTVETWGHGDMGTWGH